MTVGETTAARTTSGALLPAVEPQVTGGERLAPRLPTVTLPQPSRTRPTIVQRLLKPGWPLAAILVPMPLWWVLGLTEWIVPIMAVPMVLHLLRARSVLVPRGFGWMLAYLLWVVAGGFLLQVQAPGTVADHSSTRVLTFGYRLGWYLGITVVLLYVVNTRREVSATRIARMLAALFVTVTFGGLLGVLAPYFQFSSFTELLLPQSLANVPLIHDMVHPAAAQSMRVLGYVSPRPSAPFAYTNTWGLVFAVTLPFFLLTWVGRGAEWRRWVAGPVLVVAAITGIYSLNRGMWGAVIAMALFVALKGAFTGRPKMLVGVVAGAGVLALTLALTPLGTIVSARVASGGSRDARTELSALAVRSVAVTSPIVGLGSTRNVQGNFSSIGGGATPFCKACSPPALGTQGQLWLVLFSNGLVGLALFVMFFVVVFLRHVRQRAPVATVAGAALVGWAVTLPVYNSLGIGMLIVMAGVGLMCREGAAAASPAGVPDKALVGLGRYLTTLRAAAPVLVVLALIGAAAGLGWAQQRPSPYSATASLLLPQPPSYHSTVSVGNALDNDAQLLNDTTVQRAVASASHQSTARVAEDLTATATANSRILHVHFSAADATAARAGVNAAVHAVLTKRGDLLEADRRRELGRLESATNSTNAGIARWNRQIRAATSSADLSFGDVSTTVMRTHRNELLAQAGSIAAQAAHVDALSLTGGSRTGPTTVSRSWDRLRVDLVSGITAGLGLGALLAMLWGAAGPRLRRVRDVHASTGLPLLCRVPAGRSSIHPVRTLLAGQPTTFVAVSERDATAAAVTDQLIDSLPRTRGHTGVVVVASDRTRVDQVRERHAWLVRQGLPVLGVLIAGSEKRLGGRRSQ